MLITKPHFLQYSWSLSRQFCKPGLVLEIRTVLFKVRFVILASWKKRFFENIIYIINKNFRKIGLKSYIWWEEFCYTLGNLTLRLALLYIISSTFIKYLLVLHVDEGTVFEDTSYCRKRNWGWGLVEKEAERKLMQYIKHNLQQWKDIVVFISQIIVVPRNWDNHKMSQANITEKASDRW